jgi:protein SCO1
MSESQPPVAAPSDDAPKVAARLRHLPIEVQRELESRPPIPGWIWFLILFCAAAPLLIMLRKPRPPEALPQLGIVPPFSMTDEQGRPAGLDALRGHVWVADFVFTHCPTVCPKLTAKMHELQAKLEQDAKTKKRLSEVRLVSISVDPENDTPPVLLAYAQKSDAHSAMWSFLTGKIEDLEPVVVKGFKIFYEKKPLTAEAKAAATSATGLMDIGHGNHFVLVDHGGHIRGYYDALDPVRFADLIAHTERLATEGDK